MTPEALTQEQIEWLKKLLDNEGYYLQPDSHEWAAAWISPGDWAQFCEPDWGNMQDTRLEPRVRIRAGQAQFVRTLIATIESEVNRAVQAEREKWSRLVCVAAPWAIGDPVLRGADWLGARDAGWLDAEQGSAGEYNTFSTKAGHDALVANLAAAQQTDPEAPND